MMRNTILAFLGHILIFVGLALLVPSLVSYAFNEPYIWLFLALGTSVMLLGFGLKVLFIKEEIVEFRSILLTVILAWVLTALIGALPYLLSGAIPNIADAVFESMSGFTTTGATILEDIEAVPQTLLFWRSFTHWIGGMGIILLIITILPSFGIQGMQLFQAEVSGGSINQKISPRIKKTAVLLWIVYVALTLGEILLLLLGGLKFL